MPELTDCGYVRLRCEMQPWPLFNACLTHDRLNPAESCYSFLPDVPIPLPYGPSERSALLSLLQHRPHSPWLLHWHWGFKPSPTVQTNVDGAPADGSSAAHEQVHVRLGAASVDSAQLNMFHLHRPLAARPCLRCPGCCLAAPC